jgi:hypothetical protein
MHFFLAGVRESAVIPAVIVVSRSKQTDLSVAILVLHQYIRRPYEVAASDRTDC